MHAFVAATPAFALQRVTTASGTAAKALGSSWWAIAATRTIAGNNCGFKRITYLSIRYRGGTLIGRSDLSLSASIFGVAIAGTPESNWNFQTRMSGWGS